MILNKSIPLLCALFPFVTFADLSLQNRIELCKQNSNEDCYFVGDAYFWGDGVKQDYKRANEYFNKACSLDHLISCSILTYMTPLLNNSEKKEISSSLNLLNPSVFEYIRTELSNPNSEYIQQITKAQYKNLSSDKLDLLKKSVALYFGNERFAWLVYNDLKRNHLINENTKGEAFGSIFAGRAIQIVDYLLSKYHYVLNDDDIICLIDFNKAVLRSLYDSKQFELCRKIALSEKLNQEEQYQTMQNVSTEMFGKKLRLMANFINSVLYESDITLKVMAHKRNEHSTSNELFEEIVSKNIAEYLSRLSKKDQALYMNIGNNLKTANSSEICKFSKDFITEILFKSDQTKQDLRMIFIISFLTEAKLDPSLSYLEDEIKKIKNQSALREHFKKVELRKLEKKN
ncbi:MAG: SEL1-like repeat protein [Succinivibrio sp.]|nr:SEL1-like repeat protein [Succinivibrio sp.]